MTEKIHMANLGFLLDYTDGTKKNEIKHDIYHVAFQAKEEVHYDRANGGSFEDMEQQPDSPVVTLLLVKDVIESVYRHNEEREFEPYIVVGYNDIELRKQKAGSPNIVITYRLLQDLEKTGEITREF